MSRVTFENYARRVAAGMNPTEVAARLPVQAIAERRILPDVMDKLQIDAEDQLLEIGCGVGTLLVPLSFMVSASAGVDHPAVLEAMAARCPDAGITLIPGNFLDMSIDQSFDKILIYSVLHCLANEEEVFAFVDRARALLAPGGRMLIGDIPNRDLKARFLSSAAGQQFEQEWRASIAAAPVQEGPEPDLLEDSELVQFDDTLVQKLVDHFHKAGLDCWVRPQPPTLPFGNSREDMLVWRRIP